jgi:hypothetical protein
MDQCTENSSYPECFSTRFELVGRSPRGTGSDRLFWRTLKGRRLNLQSVNRSEYHHVRPKTLLLQYNCRPELTVKRAPSIVECKDSYVAPHNCAGFNVSLIK